MLEGYTQELALCSFILMNVALQNIPVKGYLRICDPLGFAELQLPEASKCNEICWMILGDQGKRSCLGNNQKRDPNLQWINGHRKEGPALIVQEVKSGGGKFVPSDLQGFVNAAL